MAQRLSIAVLFLLALGILGIIAWDTGSQHDARKEAGAPLSAAELEAEAKRIHDAVITIDTHVDIPPQWGSPTFDPGADGPWQVDLPKMRRGGLDAAFFIVYVGQDERTVSAHAAAASLAFEKFAGIRRMTDELYGDDIALATTAGGIEAAAADGKLIALIGIENGYVLGRDLSLLDAYYKLGARYLGLTHNGHNEIGDAAIPLEKLGDGDTEHGGLSDWGRAVIRRANELGIMIDVSHASKATTLEAVEASRAPVIASHSSAAAIFEHPRNLDDEALRAIARKGGVIQVVAFDSYLHATDPEKSKARRDIARSYGIASLRDLGTLSPGDWAAYKQDLKALDEQWPRATVSDLVDHIDHVVAVAGIDHVGISSDFGGGGGIDGWMDATETLNVTRELLRRGYGEEDIAKIWGGNLMRVMREAEETASVRFD